MTAQSKTAFPAAPADVCDAVRSARNIALIGHVTPDADCIGVLGGMSLTLRAMGKTPRVSMPAGSVARKLEFLWDISDMAPASAQELAACDLALVMDTAKAKRVNVDGKLEAMPNVPVANVDHHSSNENFGRWNWVEAQRSSSCEMVYDLIRTLRQTVTPPIATLLYAGIHSDTQGFSLSNTTPRSFQVAHELCMAGADIIDTCERLCRSQTRSEFDLYKAIYRNTQVSPDGRVAWSTISHEEITGAGCHANDIDNQVEVVRSIEGVKIAVLFSEGTPGKIRMNFRGERGFPVLALAQKFKGGGHDQAAGAILDGPVENVVKQVIPAAIEAAQ